jgi:hypothetical protein
MWQKSPTWMYIFPLPDKPFCLCVYHYVKIKVVKYDKGGCGGEGNGADGGGNGSGWGRMTIRRT